jgi:hypothetical protein
LKHFELCGGFFGLGSSFCEEDFHALELFICKLNEPDLTIGRDDLAYSVHVDGRVFLACAVPIVD